MTYWQRFLCNFLSWHKPDRNAPESMFFDGCSFHAICARCRRKIMEDSQGGWFELVEASHD